MTDTTGRGYIGYNLTPDDTTQTTIHVYDSADRYDWRRPVDGATPVTVIGPYRGRAHNKRAWTRCERLAAELLRR